MAASSNRVQVTLSGASHKWLYDNFREQGYSALSKYVASIVDEYVKGKTPMEPEPEPERPLTPDEEVDKIVEEIGNLTVTHNEKFEAIRSLVPKDAPEMQTLEDVKKRIVLIWSKVREENGFVKGGRNKIIPISRVDLKSYKQLCDLQLKKLELLKAMSVAEAQ